MEPDRPSAVYDGDDHRERDLFAAAPLRCGKSLYVKILRIP